MKKIAVSILSLTLLTGCSVSSNSLLMNNPTQQELAEAKESINEAKAELSDAREEINQREDITSFEKNISNWAIDFAENFAIDLAESVVDSKTKGDD